MARIAPMSNRRDCISVMMFFCVCGHSGWAAIIPSSDENSSIVP